MLLALSILPVVILIVLMTLPVKGSRWVRLPLPAHVALPAVAVLAYGLQLFCFRPGSTAATLRRCCPQASVSTVVKPGDPKYALIDLADAWEEDGLKGADCIFLGARGVRGVERFLLGSVSTAVAMNAHCSMNCRD